MKHRIIEYKHHLKERNLAVNTRLNYLSGVKSFYKSFDHIILNIGKEEKAQPKKEHLDIPTKDDIRQALKVCDVRDRAIVLVGCSSGLSASDFIVTLILVFKVMQSFDQLVKSIIIQNIINLYAE